MWCTLELKFLGRLSSNRPSLIWETHEESINYQRNCIHLLSSSSSSSPSSSSSSTSSSFGAKYLPSCGDVTLPGSVSLAFIEGCGGGAAFANEVVGLCEGGLPSPSLNEIRLVMYGLLWSCVEEDKDADGEWAMALLITGCVSACSSLNDGKCLWGFVKSFCPRVHSTHVLTGGILLPSGGI